MAVGSDPRQALEAFGAELCRTWPQILRCDSVYAIDTDSLHFRVSFRGGRHQEFILRPEEFLFHGTDGFTQWCEQVIYVVEDECNRTPAPDPAYRVDVIYGWTTVGPAMHSPWGQSHGPKADATAELLFKQSAGDESHKLMASRGWIDVIGSLGTPYRLHKKMTYCVERKKDGTKLCALVPGVPLWDHLLGVKLMLEHDEQAFLNTANVAR